MVILVSLVIFFVDHGFLSGINIFQYELKKISCCARLTKGLGTEVSEATSI